MLVCQIPGSLCMQGYFIVEAVYLISCVFYLYIHCRAELEADHIGLMIMAAAGFDPRVAPEFRKKIGEIIGDTKLMDYIGTHPSFETRSRMLSRKEVMEEALGLYKQERMRREKCQSLSSLWWNVLGYRSC